MEYIFTLNYNCSKWVNSIELQNVKVNFCSRNNLGFDKKKHVIDIFSANRNLCLLWYLFCLIFTNISHVFSHLTSHYLFLWVGKFPSKNQYHKESHRRKLQFFLIIVCICQCHTKCDRKSFSTIVLDSQQFFTIKNTKNKVSFKPYRFHKWPIWEHNFQCS